MKPIALLALGLVAACAWDSPKRLATPTPDNPCGEAWHECFDGEPLKSTGTCCGSGDVCGGSSWQNIGCPPGACCHENAGGAPGMPRAPMTVTPQRPVVP